VSLDRVRGLKALQRSSTPDVRNWQASFLNDRDGLHVCTKAIQNHPDRLSQSLGAIPKTNQYGDYLSVRCWCAQPPRYSPDLRALRLLTPEAADEIADPDQWLFLDTETTGLAGGSGTYAFLVGVAWWESGGLEIEQFFIREYSEERSLLFALGERIAEHPVLVTFNGKSFDWPLLETRYRMSRRISVPTPRAHLDFLHPARNLWRLRLGSVRLSELERHVLNWDRGTDVLSGLIPQIYFDYVRGGPPERLVPVLHHNQMDLRGLAALSSRILSLLSDAENIGENGLELFGALASAKSEVNTAEPASFTRSRLLPSCRPKPIGQHGAPLRGSLSGKAISIWRVNSGKMHLKIHGTAMRPTSSLRSTTNTRPVPQSKLDK